MIIFEWLCTIGKHASCCYSINKTIKKENHECNSVYSECDQAQADQYIETENPQLIAIKAYCVKHGVTLLSTFEDKATSGMSFDRPGWNDMETYLSDEKGKVQLVIVNSIDRIGRDRDAVTEKISFLKKTHALSVIALERNGL